MPTKATGRYFESVGRRKTSIARVRLTPASKSALTINGRELEKYFVTEELQKVSAEILNQIKSGSKFAITIKVSGGGIHSQAEAVRHGIARALLVYKEELKGELRKIGALTRDGRAKERRKFGLKKARKSPQWSKR